MARISSTRARPVSGRSIRTMIRVLRISASTLSTKTTSRSLTTRSLVTFRPTDRNVGHHQYKKTAQSERGYRKLCAVSFVVCNCDVLQDVAHDISFIDAVSDEVRNNNPYNVISREKSRKVKKRKSKKLWWGPSNDIHTGLSNRFERM